MKDICTKKWAIAVLLTLSWLPPTMAAQFVEVAAEIEVTFWSLRGTESRSTNSVRCIVGTNRWMIEGEFTRNAMVTYWFTGTNLIVGTVITKMLPEFSGGKIGGLVTKVPEIGDRSARSRPMSNGGPTDGSGRENVVWLAYCSGAYLKQDGQPIPLPIGTGPRTEDYSQTNTVFEDALALPKSVELHTPDNHLICRYDVQQSTNVAGWTLPQKFKVTQYRRTLNGGVGGLHAEAVGRLTSVRNTNEPRIPEEVLSHIRQ